MRLAKYVSSNSSDILMHMYLYTTVYVAGKDFSVHHTLLRGNTGRSLSKYRMCSKTIVRYRLNLRENVRSKSRITCATKSYAAFTSDVDYVRIPTTTTTYLYLAVRVFGTIFELRLITPLCKGRQ